MNQKTDCFKTFKQITTNTHKITTNTHKITTNTHKIPSNQTTQQQPSTPKIGEVIISQDRERNVFILEKLCK